MFLSELKPKQKELFLDLGICLSKSDGLFDTTEKKSILEMCREMGIENRLEKEHTFEDALSLISAEITKREKRIVLLETAGIVLADGEFSEEEELLVKKISEGLGIEYSEYENVLETVKELLKIYSKIGEFLTKK